MRDFIRQQDPVPWLIIIMMALATAMGDWAGVVIYCAFGFGTAAAVEFLWGKRR